MADDQTTQQQQQAPNAPPVAPPSAGASAQSDATSKALADAAAKAERDQLDESDVEGGHYVVGGQHVNAYGKPVKKSAKGKWELVNEDDRREIGS